MEQNIEATEREAYLDYKQTSFLFLCLENISVTVRAQSPELERCSLEQAACICFCALCGPMYVI